MLSEHCWGPRELISCTTCSTGYTLNSPSTCVKCNAACKTCSEGSSTNCQQCSTGYFLDEATSDCALTCPGAQFADATVSWNPVCSSCYHTCEKCTGDQHHHCLECKEGYYWDPMANDCKTECHKSDNVAENYYEIPDKKQCKLSCEVDNTCEICSSKCKTCYGENIN